MNLIFQHGLTSVDRFPAAAGTGYGSIRRRLEGPLPNPHAERPGSLQPGLLARVATVFLPAAALGTVGHELGHWCAAWLAGCAPVLHFASVSPHCTDVSETTRMWGVALGPLGTMLTGCIGLMLLRRWRRQHERLDLEGTLYTVLALFWSRPAFNLMVQMGLWWSGYTTLEDSANNDEARLSIWLGLPQLTLGCVCAILAVIGSVWTARQVPLPDRTSWLVGAIVGALLGFAVWMGPVGPMLLP